MERLQPGNVVQLWKVGERTKIGQYTLGAKPVYEGLGTSRRAIIWKAESLGDTTGPKVVAIKYYEAENDEAALKRLEHERDVLNDLQGIEHVIRLVGQVTFKNILVGLALEWAPRRDLEAPDRSMSHDDRWRACLNWLVPIAGVLEAAVRRFQVVHCDVGMKNILTGEAPPGKWGTWYVLADWEDAHAMGTTEAVQQRVQQAHSAPSPADDVRDLGKAVMQFMGWGQDPQLFDPGRELLSVLRTSPPRHGRRELRQALDDMSRGTLTQLDLEKLEKSRQALQPQSSDLVEAGEQISRWVMRLTHGASAVVWAVFSLLAALLLKPLLWIVRRIVALVRWLIIPNRQHVFRWALGRTALVLLVIAACRAAPWVARKVEGFYNEHKDPVLDWMQEHVPCPLEDWKPELCPWLRPKPGSRLAPLPVASWSGCAVRPSWRGQGPGLRPAPGAGAAPADPQAAAVRR